MARSAVFSGETKAGAIVFPNPLRSRGTSAMAGVLSSTLLLPALVLPGQAGLFSNSSFRRNLPSHRAKIFRAAGPGNNFDVIPLRSPPALRRGKR